MDRLIARVLTGEANAAEQAELDDWLRDPVNAEYFENARRVVGAADKHFAAGRESPLIDVDAEWKLFSERVGSARTGASRRLLGVPQIVRIAAGLLIIAAAAFAINYLVSEPDEIRFETFAETQRLELPDGSVVTLNRHSSLAYDSDFNDKERSLRLEGEAFFDVTPDPQRPFVISSGAARVAVVGTTFNVSAYKNDAQLTVTVETGVVELSGPASKKLVLKPGDAGTFTKSDGSLSLQTNPDVNYKSWSTRHIEFDGTSLQDVVKTLNRTYGANITITGPIADNCVVTVTFDQQTLEAVLRVLETTLNLTYRVNGNSIEITSAKC